MYETTMTMVGRLVDRPQRWDLEGAGLKATFRLAHTSRRMDKERGEWIDGHSLYLTVNTWRVLAERVLATFAKGDPVIVQGSLKTREWEKDGKRHSVIEMEATAVGPDLSRCCASVVHHPPAEPRGETTARPQPGAEERPQPGAEARAEPGAEERPWPEEPPAVDPWSPVDEHAEAAVGV